MNKVVLVGRITKDPELKKTSSDIYYVQFTIAVNRQFKSNTGERQADFISCIAWRQTAEIISKYVRKGQQIGIDGSIQTRNYDDQNGIKHYVTEVVVDNFYFLEAKKDEVNSYGDFQQTPFMGNGNAQNNNRAGYNQGYNQGYNAPQGFGPQAFNKPQGQYQQAPTARPYNTQPSNQNYKAAPNYSAPQKSKDIFEDIESSFVSDDDLPF